MINDQCERGFLFSPDGNTLLFEKEADKGKCSLEFSEEELKRFPGNILTHSHTNTPKGYHFFTNHDLITFFSSKLAEIRLIRGKKCISLIHNSCCNLQHPDIEIRCKLAKDGPENMVQTFQCLSVNEWDIENEL